MVFCLFTMSEENSIKILSNTEYKKSFLPDVSDLILNNKSSIQLYRLESYLRNILIPVTPYRTTFNFVLFVKKGRLKQYLDGEEYVVNEGEFLYIKQGSITATLEITKDIEGYFLLFENEIFTSPHFTIKHPNLFFISPYFSSENLGFESFIKVLKLMEYELFVNQYQDNEIVLSMLRAVLLKMIEQGNQNPTKVSRSLEITLKFRNLLHENHKQEKKVSFYAEQLHLTENYLNKCLKEVTGKTPKQWINEIDIDYSKTLLQTGKSISEIAYELNFQTPSHFSQVFKKLIGISPTDFRLKFQNNK
ncbi:AraC family transcriptional regulator [Ornithobacterium rhinotracheale]|nr:AraC family transcriptional regulator [Ornithobacterium rhinotracheale]MRJ10644.1 AraC family transcriptional regulator [Ornithobacterium rhinotracheale]